MKKYLKATSLVEVLVVLGIISSTIIGSMVLVSNSFVVVRQNQTEDYVNGLLVSTMEILKSPSNIFVTDNSFEDQTSPSFFSLKNNGQSSYLERTYDQPIDSCDSGSTYLLTPSSNSNTTAATRQQTNNQTNNQTDSGQTTGVVFPDVCVQVEVQPVTPIGAAANLQSYYQITIRAVYLLDNKTQVVDFKSNRYESFKQV